MSAVVVYRSQTGSARMYAQWLAESLTCAVAPVENIDEAAHEANLVILSGWFHAASLKGSKELKAYMAKHPEKHYAVVAVGATPMPSKDWPASEHEEAFRRSFPAEQYPDLPWCYCRGRFFFDQLNALDKIAMRVYFRMLESAARKGSRRDSAALEGMRRGFDACDRSYLEPLLDELRARRWID